MRSRSNVSIGPPATIRPTSMTADTYAVMDVGRIVAGGPIETFERERMHQLMSV